MSARGPAPRAGGGAIAAGQTHTRTPRPGGAGPGRCGVLGSGGAGCPGKGPLSRGSGAGLGEGGTLRSPGAWDTVRCCCRKASGRAGWGTGTLLSRGVPRSGKVPLSRDVWPGPSDHRVPRSSKVPPSRGMWQGWGGPSCHRVLSPDPAILAHPPAPRSSTTILPPLSPSRFRQEIPIGTACPQIRIDERPPCRGRCLFGTSRRDVRGNLMSWANLGTERAIV